MRNSARVEGAARFVTLWQEYLSHLSKGYDEQAKNILRELDARPLTHPLLTHEQILSKIGPEPKAEAPGKILAAVKNLDELTKAIAELAAANKARRSTDPGTYQTTADLNHLKQIGMAHAAASAERYE